MAYFVLINENVTNACVIARLNIHSLLSIGFCESGGRVFDARCDVVLVDEIAKGFEYGEKAKGRNTLYTYIKQEPRRGKCIKASRSPKINTGEYYGANR